MAEETRRYLVILSLSDTTPQRLETAVPHLRDILARLSTTAPETAFRSKKADMVGFFIRSTKVAAQISARLESPGKESFYADTPIEEPPLSGADSLFVVEIGEDFKAGRGFTRAGTWLQRH